MASASGGQAMGISFGADQLAAAALHAQQAHGHATLGVNHWLLALLEQQREQIDSLVSGGGGEAFAAQLRERLNAGDSGKPLSREVVVAEASERAAREGRALVTVSDVAQVIAAAAGDALAGLGQGAAQAPGQQVSQPHRASRPTPTLEQFGRDLTREAQEGKLPRIVGRDDEIELAAEIICRRTKRNPALVGPAGTGKTAIVEGLAQRIVSGDVPEPLRGARIIALQPSNLTAGAGVVGELEKRMKAVLEEACQEGIILFIDELHSIVGVGGMPGSGDVAALLKPALARGDLACIGATTDDEYRRFIEPDKALERRFNRVRVQEMTSEQTRAVLDAHREKLEELRGIEIPDVVVDWLLEFAGEYLRNRFFPDKAVDLLEQCMAHAVARNETVVDLADARAVAERMVGMPVGLGERLRALEQRLTEEGLLPEEAVDGLLDRLNVSLRGLEARPQRPSAIVLLMGEAAAMGEPLAQGIAGTLFGSDDRVVTIDFAGFEHPADINTLVGPPPGYIGFGGHLPLHDVAQMPWCVLRCTGVDQAHPDVRDVLREVLSNGVVTERSGNRIYLSDAVVLLSAGSGDVHRRPGFYPPDEAGPAVGGHAAAERALGPDFSDLLDVVCVEVPSEEAARRSWITRSLLAGLAERYRHEGARLEWDASFVDWVLAVHGEHETRARLGRFVEERLADAVIPLLPEPGAGETALVVTAEKGEVKAEARRGAEAEKA
jgi:ATP-dependent Clp protease ATP-binding subunit ClpC